MHLCSGFRSKSAKLISTYFRYSNFSSYGRIHRTGILHHEERLAFNSSRNLSNLISIGDRRLVVRNYFGSLQKKSYRSAVRLYSTQNSDDDNDGNKPYQGVIAAESDSVPATVVVPEVWPNVPLIALNGNPVFPRFTKVIEVSILEAMTWGIKCFLSCV